MNNTTLKLATQFSLFALGATLLSSAGAATVKSHTTTVPSIRTTSNFPAAVGPTVNAISLQTWDVTTADGKVFLALCVQPGVPLNVKTADYTNAGTFTFAADRQENIARLYSHYYSAITGASETAQSDSLSFQLALWELNNDNADLKSGTLSLAWKESNQTWSGARPEFQGVVNRAADMIRYASTATNPIEQTYLFTQWTMQDSQTIVVAAPVPEPATYAMLGLGLGLVAFAARRRSQR